MDHLRFPDATERPQIYIVIMAPISGKRSRDSRSQNSRKRQRADPSERLSEQPKAMTLDALPWAEVSFPGEFEDAEGFFGLEEISDVELLRNPNIGKLECRVGEWFIKRNDVAKTNLCSYL